MPKANNHSTAATLIPERYTLPQLREIAAGCKACDLWMRGTQTVFGEGKSRAHLMMVGEQPGDKEELERYPFVGPAGPMLDKVLGAAGIARDEVHLSDVVKHMKSKHTAEHRIPTKPES